MQLPFDDNEDMKFRKKTYRKNTEFDNNVLKIEPKKCRWKRNKTQRFAPILIIKH